MKTSAIRRGLAESAFIVIGILVAFSIDAWWDGRQEARMHGAILDSLSSEIARNQELLGRDLRTIESHLDRIDRFLQSSPEELSQLPQDSLRGFTNAFGNPVTYDPETAIAAMLMALPAQDPTGLSIQEYTGRWLRVISDAEEQAGALWSLVDELWPILARSSLPFASDGLESMTGMNARIGPQGLGQLRTDPEVTSVVIVKGQMQGNYRNELRRGAALLDTLATVIASAR